MNARRLSPYQAIDPRETLVPIMESIPRKPREPDVCGWCGKNLSPRVEVIWREMRSIEGIAITANYCPLSKIERNDPAMKGKPSACYVQGHANMAKVSARLRKYLSTLVTSNL